MPVDDSTVTSLTQQCAKVGNVGSESLPMTKGAPQGSIVFCKPVMSTFMQITLFHTKDIDYSHF